MTAVRDLTKTKKVIVQTMRVLMISGDPRLVEVGTPAQKRLELQQAHAEQLDVFVWPQRHAVRDIFIAARNNHYDVVTAQDPFWRGLLAWRIVRRTKAKLNLQVHTDLRAQSFIRRFLARFLLRRADSVRVVSEKIKQQVERLGVRVPVHVLPIFVEVSEFRTLQRKSHKQKTILWVGRFETEKDPCTAISVLEQVHRTGIDAQLVMLGDGSEKQHLRQRARGFPVTFPGWQDSKPYLEVADVVLCTSKHESWGASIVEALAAGAPVVAPDVGIAEEAGAIVVPRSELASAVANVLRSDVRGELKLMLPSAEEWARRWRETLV